LGLSFLPHLIAQTSYFFSESCEISSPLTWSILYVFLQYQKTMLLSLNEAPFSYVFIGWSFWICTKL
jgi:hypothetical protein